MKHKPSDRNIVTKRNHHGRWECDGRYHLLNHSHYKPQPTKPKLSVLSKFSNEQITQPSIFAPRADEYEDYPNIAQQIAALTGCKFLSGSPLEFCNKLKIMGKPYCSEHQALCFKPTIELKSG